MKWILTAMLLAFTLCEEEPIISDLEFELSDTWVLDNKICYCYFGEDADFNNTWMNFDPTLKTISVTEYGPEPYGYEFTGSQPYRLRGDVVTIKSGRPYQIALFKSHFELLGCIVFKAEIDPVELTSIMPFGQ